jgi:hypothetical protein
MVVNQSVVSLRQTSLLTEIHQRNLLAGIIRRLSLEVEQLMLYGHFVGRRNVLMPYQLKFANW